MLKFVSRRQPLMNVSPLNSQAASFTRQIFQNEKYIVVPDGKHSGSTMPLADIFRDHMDAFFDENN